MSDGAWREEYESSTRALRSLSGKEPPPAVRQRIVQGALARRDKRTPWAKAIAGLALASAAAAVALVVYSPVVPPDRGPIDAAPGALPAARAGAVADTGRWAIGGHVVEIGAGASVRFASVDPAAAELQLERGSASFEVEPLVAGGSFRVRTEQVLVEVVGTRFEVGVEGACSEVKVSKGRVRVTAPQGIVELGAGESGRYCAAVGAEALVREAVVLVSRGKDLHRAVELLERYRATVQAGPLEEEALFYLTLARARLGEREAAEELARTFRERFPESPRSERLKLWLERTVD